MGDGERAAVVLVVHALIWVLATPGLDYLGKHSFITERERSALREEVGEPLARAAFAAAAFNRSVRLPLTDLIAPLQRPFRISQEWNLYRDGPSRYRLLEVWVDGQLRFRTADDAHDWLAPQLRNRRVRPVVESTAMRKGSPNWRGLTRFIVARALAEDAGVREVELRALEGPFPGTELKVHHRVFARAPGWEPAEQ